MQTITPNDDQQIAIDKIEAWLRNGSNQTFALGGLAGTGKSSLIPNIYNLAESLGRHVTIGTPTGKAATVINKKFGRDVAETIHSIAYRPLGNRRRSDRKDHLGREVLEPEFEPSAFAADVFIIDEASMVTTRVMDDLLGSDAQFLFIGDYGQLPPVGEDLSPALVTRDHTLSTIVRQEEGNPIRGLAYDVREGHGILDSDFSRGNDRITTYAYRRSQDIAKSAYDHGCDFIIAALNATRHNINEEYRKLLGYGGKPPLSPGETVLICSTSRPQGIFNGELYTVGEVLSRHSHKEGEVIRCKLMDETGKIHGKDKSWEVKTLGFQWRSGAPYDSEIRQPHEVVSAADFGYCLTCHKAQGSQGRHIAVVNEDIGWMRGNAASWRYTAVTRAQSKLSVYG